MSITVEIGEAAAQLSDLLAKVEAGEEVILARAKTPVAKLTKVDHATDVEAAIAAIRDLRRRLPQKTTIEEIIAWKNEDRR